MQVGDKVEIIYRLKGYSTYKEWVQKNANIYMDNFICGNLPKNGSIGTIVAKAKHKTYSIMLYGVMLGKQLVIMEEGGLKKIMRKKYQYNEFVGRSIRITNKGSCYDTYQEWMKKCAPQYLPSWQNGKQPTNYTSGTIVVAKPHLEHGNIIFLVAIPYIDTVDYFIMDECGLHIADNKPIECYIKDFGQCYPSHEEWMKQKAKIWMPAWKKNAELNRNCYGQILVNGESKYLVLVGEQVYIIDAKGVNISSIDTPIQKKSEVEIMEQSKGQVVGNVYTHKSGTKYRKTFDHTYYTVFARADKTGFKVLILTKESFSPCWKDYIKGATFSQFSEKHFDVAPMGYERRYFTITVTSESFRDCIGDLVRAMISESDEFWYSI